MSQVIMEQERKREEESDRIEPREEHQPPFISQMQPVTHEAYGGGLYGKDDDDSNEKETDNNEKEQQQHKPASETQSADGPDEAKTIKKPTHKPPPSSGDVDIDVTGQSYIQ